MPAHCCFKWLINSDMALKVKDVKDSKIIKLVVLIMGGGEHRFAIRYKKRSFKFMKDLFLLLRRQDSNLRPLGYEPNELPLLHSAIYVCYLITGAKVGNNLYKTN